MTDIELFTTVFAAKIHAVTPSADDLTEAQASLRDLKTLLPPDINPADDPDILFVAGNLAVAGEVNLNDDGLDIPTALAVYKRFEKKQVNIEHNRDKIVGYIIRAGLSELGTDRILTEDEARASGKPFNITTVAALWRVASKDLCNYIAEASNPSHPDYGQLSLSWEMGFKDYYIASLPKGDVDISHASKVVQKGDEDFTRFNKALRAYKGNGVSPDSPDQHVYRIMPESVIPLGQGVVTVPAAAVKGVIAITTPQQAPEVAPPVPTVADDMDYQGARQEATKTLGILDKKTVTSIISAKTCVSQDIENLINLSIHHMNKADLQKIKDQASSAKSPEDFQQVFAATASLADIIAAESVRLEEENKSLANQKAALEQAKIEAQANHDKLAADFAALQKELNDIKSAQLAEAAQRAFDARMTTLDSEFDLDDDTRAFLMTEIKACDSDESFAKKLDTLKKVMKEKTKAFKKKQKDDAKDKSDQMRAALAAKGINVTIDADSLDFKEIIASAQENVTSAPISNTVHVGATSLAEQAKAAFADMVIGGKKLSDLSKKE